MKVVAPITLKALALQIGARLQGDPECAIYKIAPIEKAKQGELTFLGNRLYKKFLSTTKASAVILSEEDGAFCPEHVNALVTTNPRLSLVKAAAIFAKTKTTSKGVHETVVIRLKLGLIQY